MTVTFCLPFVSYFAFKKRLLKLVPTIFCQICLFSLNDIPSKKNKCYKKIFLCVMRKLFLFLGYSIFCDFSRVASDFCNENSRTIQERFKNI